MLPLYKKKIFFSLLLFSTVLSPTIEHPSPANQVALILVLKRLKYILGIFFSL